MRKKPVKIATSITTTLSDAIARSENTLVKIGGVSMKYVVIDGTPRKPAGYIGTYNTKQEALEARFKLCRMGGYIRKEKVEVKQ